MKKEDTIKPLVKAMKAALKRDHSISVPYSALRASYLTAQGLNPHAAKEKAKSKAKGSKSADASDILNRDGWLTKTLYLAMDDIGCMELIALDADGTYLCQPPCGFNDKESELVHIKAQVPSIKRYGLPDFLQHQAEWFRNRFGLILAAGSTFDIEDLGDDSGETVELTVRMTPNEWSRIVLATLASVEGLADSVAEWVGTHYKENFTVCTISKKVEWFERFMETHNSSDEALSADAIRPFLEEGGDIQQMRLEWVYDDEDLDFVKCRVDTATGEVLLNDGEEVSADAEHLDRVRIDIQADDYDAQYDVFLDRGVSPPVWRLTKYALDELQETLAGTDLS